MQNNKYLLRSSLHLLFVQLTPEVLQSFRTVTAEAVNSFCNQTVCIVNEQKLVLSFFSYEGDNAHCFSPYVQCHWTPSVARKCRHSIVKYPD